jgi:hypothetical protein
MRTGRSNAGNIPGRRRNRTLLLPKKISPKVNRFANGIISLLRSAEKRPVIVRVHFPIGGSNFILTWPSRQYKLFRRQTVAYDRQDHVNTGPSNMMKGLNPAVNFNIGDLGQLSQTGFLPLPGQAL